MCIRDRLQSGLSSGVIVIEAEAEDGTMHTARFAVEQRRLLGCLKPPTDVADIQQKVATGNEFLISEGKALPLTSDSDSVSYTHLDVYKRQTLTWRICL